MNKVVELTKSQKDEDKLLIAKTLDKIKLVEARNRFENTDFLDLSQKYLLEDILNKRKVSNYKFFGGFEQAERTILFLFPDTYSNDKIFGQVMSVIRITLPKELWKTFEHGTYLGALMKLGVKREKVGDILVRDDGADIVILSSIEKFVLNNLTGLKRFHKSKVESLDISEIKYVEKPKQVFKINVPSMRLDAIVGELAKVSRNDANTYIEQERIFVNFKQELRNSIQIEEGTIITIRGKGRFTIAKILGETRSNRINLGIEKW